MAYLIPLLVIAFSIAGLSYILINKIKSLSGANLPVVDSGQSALKGDFQSKGDKLGHNILERFFERMGEDDIVFVFMEKFFRKMRVRMMKIENFLTNIADRLHKRSVERKMEQSDKPINSAEGSNEEKNKKISVSSMEGGDSGFDEKYWLGVLKHNPGSAYPYKKLGEIYMGREDFSEARSMLRYALKLEPDDSEIKQMIESLKGKRNKK